MFLEAPAEQGGRAHVELELFRQVVVALAAQLSHGQIAVALGATVTGVCGPASVGLVRSLGADRVVDYTTEDILDGDERWDVVLDNVGNLAPRRVRRALAPDGTLVHNAGGSPGRLFGAVGATARLVVTDLFVRRRLRVLPTRMLRDELLDVTRLVDQGALRTVLDRTYQLADVAEGLRYVETGHAHGEVAVTVIADADADAGGGGGGDAGGGGGGDAGGGGGAGGDGAATRRAPRG
jgi:D-arabinose 1-dehydrogenase-like Zn-dependent alcohol dehydrogenase